MRVGWFAVDEHSARCSPRLAAASSNRSWLLPQHAQPPKFLPMLAWLENREGQKFQLQGNCVIGRLADCSIVLQGTLISRRHGLIHSPDGCQFVIVDLASTNGIYVRGYRVRQNCVLQDGDEIRIGEHCFAFRWRPDPATVPAAQASWIRTARADTGLISVGYGIIVIDASGKPEFSTERARDWLTSYFPAHRSGGLPKELIRWFERQTAAPGDSVPPLVAQRETSQLVIRIAERSGKNLVLMLTEEGPASVRRLVDSLGLTPREGEVLRWLVEGKSNAEIATILGMASGTAAKHIQHLFMKLGVTNRSEAVRTVMDALGRQIV